MCLKVLENDTHIFGYGINPIIPIALSWPDIMMQIYIFFLRTSNHFTTTILFTTQQILLYLKIILNKKD